MSTVNSLRQSAAMSRLRSRVSDQEARRTGAAYASAVALGIMSKPKEGETESTLDKASVFGLPGSVVVALVAKAGATFADGDVADYLNGIGDAGAIIALSQFARGETVAGTLPAVSGRPSGNRAAALERAIRRRLANERAAAREQLEDDVDADA